MDTTGLQVHVLVVPVYQLGVNFATRVIVSLAVTLEAIILIQIIVQDVVLLCLIVKYAPAPMYAYNAK